MKKHVEINLIGGYCNAWGYGVGIAYETHCCKDGRFRQGDDLIGNCTSSGHYNFGYLNTVPMADLNPNRTCNSFGRGRG